MNKATFYQNIKENKLFSKLAQSQVDSMEALLRQCVKQNVTDKKQIAYIMATVYHETALKVKGVFTRTMWPVEEVGKGVGRTYGYRVYHSGKPYRDVSHIYYGRGHTQNTWRENYRKLTVAAKKEGYDWDFEHKPELLLELEPSAWATVYAMKVGLYTGKKLSDYLSEKLSDWIGARRIINGNDQAELIKTYALKFYYSLLNK